MSYAIDDWRSLITNNKNEQCESLFKNILNEVKNSKTYINGEDKYFKGYKPNYYFKDVRR